MHIQVIILIIFILAAGINVISNKKLYKFGENLSKPLLMPLLILLYLLSVNTPNWYIVFALMFGFIGDVLLMGKEALFIIGLVSFLIGHVFYISAFIKTTDFSSIPYGFYLLILAYGFLGAFIFRGLKPYLKSMKPYAILYITAILTMSFTSLLRIDGTNGYQLWLPFIGSIFFIVSDTMLAYSIFKPGFKNRGTYIMITYIIGQFLIVSGFIW